jgi:hypothetical protein
LNCCLMPQWLDNHNTGNYYLYAVKNGDGTTEYSFFAPDDVHATLKENKKGARFTITKLAEQKGSKIITKYDVVPLQSAPTEPVPQQEETKQETAIQPAKDIPVAEDKYFAIMLNSCRDAMRIQSELGGMMDAKSLAVTLFIARSK